MSANEHYERLRTPGPEACRLVEAETGDLSVSDVAWTTQQAPGCTLPPADDARSTMVLLQGWTKLAIPSLYEDLEGTGTFTNTLYGWKQIPLPQGLGPLETIRGAELPDEWPSERNYHHAWYGMRLRLAPADLFRTFVRFDAVGHACELYVNGVKAGRHIGGYTPFEFEISGLLKPSVNTLQVWVQDETAVRDVKAKRAISQLDGGRGVVHSHLSGVRGGIYLERRRAVHVDRLRIRTFTRDQRIQVETWLDGRAGEVRVEHEIYEWPRANDPVLTLPTSGPAAGLTPCVSEARWEDAKHWSPAHPHLYVLRTKVSSNGVSETVETRFGFREFRIEGQQFLLNDRPFRFHGDGSHPREIRSIVPEQARDYNRQWLLFLKEHFHFNSSRLHGSLYPVWAVEAADEAGVLLMNQTGLRHGQMAAYENGGREFLENLKVEFEAWYWRDVNSPSAVVWDLENELIRGSRPPEREAWVLGLDETIRKHDPAAIIQHSGAAYYHPDQDIIHVHMQEQYRRIMREWVEGGIHPLVMGEFWVGGRGETRLPGSQEYSDREDWHRYEAEFYRERMLEMRYHGVTGIMPHRLTKWCLQDTPGPLIRAEAAGSQLPRADWRFPNFKNLAARGLAPVVVFAWPRSASVPEGKPFQRELVVCNDREEEVSVRVTWQCADTSETHPLTLGPGEQHRFQAEFPPPSGSTTLAVTVCDPAENLLEEDAVVLHAVPARQTEPPKIRRRLVVVPPPDASTRQALDELGLVYECSDSLPDRPAETVVLVPSSAEDDALGRKPAEVRRFLEAGGRLLVLSTATPPRWLPLGLPFASASRTSIPEFDRGGWPPTNKDLIYSRDTPIYAGSHPAFEGLVQADFKDWHPVDGRISDDVFIRPNAMGTGAEGPYRVLLGATRRENA